MIWLLGGYLWLYVHRPFEVWPALGAIQIERAYMLGVMLVWLVTPNKGWPANKAHLGLALFAAVLGLAWVASPFADAPGCSETVENYYKVLVFYVLVVTTVRDGEGLRKLLLMYLGAVGLYALHSLYEYGCGRYESRMGVDRMVGVDLTYRDPNAFAAGLLVAIAMCLPFWREKPRRLPAGLIIGYVGLLGGCIILTGSRTGFLGLLMISVVLPFLLLERKSAAIGLIAAGMAVGLASFPLMPEKLQNRYLTIIDSSRGPENARTSADGRVTGFYKGIDLWQASPLLGHGPGSFPIASRLQMQPHNLYGQVLSEMGSVGAAALGVVVLCFFLNWRETRRLARALGPTQAGLPYQLSLTVFLTVVLLLLLGFAGHNLYRYHWQWLTAFQVVAVHCLRQRAAVAGAAEVYPAGVPAWQGA